MTYRDISHLCEMARVLSFPRLISMENFRQPNFRLVAELMTWLAKQYDPLCDVPSDIDGEQDRVIFIRTVTQIMATKAHVKLNTKKLYQADVYAIKEILKVITPLYKALRESENKELDDEDDVDQQYRYAMNDDISTLKNARQLCSAITQKGAHLHELLGKELDAREARQEVLNRAMELSDVLDGIREAENAAKRELVKYEKLIDNVQTDELALDEKIAKRLEEKERHQRRLDMLKSVRPSFMTDFDKYEAELNELYTNYVLKFRILSYLEKELEGHSRTQREKVEEVSRQYMQSMNSQLTEQDQQRFNRQLQDANDEIGVHSDGDEDDEDSDGDSNDNSDEDEVSENQPARARQPAARGNQMRGKSYGGMTAELSDNDSDDVQMTRDSNGIDESEGRYDGSNDHRRRGEGNLNRRPPSASGQRRLKSQQPQRAKFDDDDDF